jgi:hypothetical protein
MTAEPAGVFEKEGSGDLLFNLATAFLGFEAAVALKDFVENYAWQVTIEDLLDDGKLAKTKEWGINDHAAMIEKFEAAEVFKAELSEARQQNLANYFVTLPSEVAMKLWTVLGDSDHVENVVALHKATSTTGVKVSDHLVTILGG